MILLDTNVVSEAMSANPSVHVIAWLDSHSIPTLGITTITLAEVLHGIGRLSRGRRRTGLETRFERFFADGLGGKAAPFDNPAAHAYARILIDRQRIGRPIQKLDAMIAAIALSRGDEVATRNVADFEACGITVINPWG